MSCFSKKSTVGTNFASLVTVVTIGYEFWIRLNSEIASGTVAVYEQRTAVNLQSQANGNIYVRKACCVGTPTSFVLFLEALQSDPKLLEKSKPHLFAGEQNEDKIFDLVSAWNGLNEVGVIKPTRKTLQAKTVRLELFSRSTHRG